MASIPIATLFIGIFVLLQIPLTILVGYRRARTSVRATGMILSLHDSHPRVRRR